MDNIIKQLVDLEHRGQEVINDAEKHIEERLIANEQENKAERKKYSDNANEKIQSYREEKSREVEMLIADKNEQYKVAINKMEFDFEQKESHLVQQIFELCIK